MLWGDSETAQTPGTLGTGRPRAIKAGEASLDDLTAVQRLLMPVGLQLRCHATVARDAGRHRGARRRNPARTRGTSARRKGKRDILQWNFAHGATARWATLRTPRPAGAGIV